ncbi:MAG: hypothetical protein ACOYYS_19700 [Chloroflexota bacterium]
MAKQTPPKTDYKAQAEKLAEAIRSDEGPLTVALSINRISGRLSIASNAGESDLETVRQAVQVLLNDIQMQQIALAEQRGKASAGESQSKN